jgi:hypothetical protein
MVESARARRTAEGGLNRKKSAWYRFNTLKLTAKTPALQSGQERVLAFACWAACAATA